MNAVNTAATVINPALGAGLSAFSHAAQGRNTAALADVLGLASPALGAPARAASSLYESGPRGALATVIDYGGRSLGIDPNSLISNLTEGKGAITQGAGSLVGDYANTFAANDVAGRAAPSSWSELADSASANDVGMSDPSVLAFNDSGGQSMQAESFSSPAESFSAPETYNGSAVGGGGGGANDFSDYSGSGDEFLGSKKKSRYMNQLSQLLA